MRMTEIKVGSNIRNNHLLDHVTGIFQTVSRLIQSLKNFISAKKFKKYRPCPLA